MEADDISKIPKNIVSFNWNRGNIKKNWKKHWVSTKECEEVFSNEPLILFEDEKHSGREKRYGVFGITNQKRGLTIIFTIRKDKIRVISARNQSRKERKSYDQK